MHCELQCVCTSRARHGRGMSRHVSHTIRKELARRDKYGRNRDNCDHRDHSDDEYAYDAHGVDDGGEGTSFVLRVFLFGGEGGKKVQHEKKKGGMNWN